MVRRLFFLLDLPHWAALLGAILALGDASPVRSGEPVDFAREVRPILSKNCLSCHGADPESREADLRLDQPNSAGDVRGAEAVLAAGDPAASELIRRIMTDDETERMPPVDSGKQLKPEEIEVLRRWVADGGAYNEHWAFVPPARPAVPRVENSGWVRNEIDAFILARLEQEGLRPSPPADRTTLLRRLSLDLIGLPPVADAVDAFLADERPEALARCVDDLLASPHFGERWARVWLDAARYADSDGFEKDKPRSVWMYRDWVIRALNDDLPYDQFVIRQIAGDLLPDAHQRERVATGFLRNSMINEEGGIDPEQFRMEAMFDRMDAVGKAVLGITVQCAQCHTHKYDPISHTDYYRMLACLNNCDEAQIAAYTEVERDEWRQTRRLIRSIEERLKRQNPDWPRQMAAWEAEVSGDPPEWTVVRPELDGSGGQKLYLLDDGSILAQGYAPTHETATLEADVPLQKITAVRLELLNDPNLPRGGPGRSIYGTCALTEFSAEAAPLGAATKLTPLKFQSATADVHAPVAPLNPAFDDLSGNRRLTGPISFAYDDDELTAWTIEIGAGRSNVPRQAVFALDKPLVTERGARVRFELAQAHGGWNSDDNQNNNLGRYRLSVTAADGATADPVPPAVRALLAIPVEQRTPRQSARIFSYWRTTVDDWAEDNRRIDELWQSHPRGDTQLVLRERDDPRVTHRLERGNFLAPAEPVTPGGPGFLPPLVVKDAVPRLAFARWLVDRRSPTAARAIVNRIWQSYFGAGLVTTAEDLGTQGDVPTHPELLDWLAVELMDHDWSLKRIHRLIVSSATYQQSSVALPEQLARDPNNQLLARGPRFRVDAEIVRDIALTASGLLTRTVGGPSVYPPAPKFLFEPPASYGPKPWAYDTGRDKYRRAMYTFRFRSSPYPMLQNFDAPNGEFACVRRVRSNTPLQALTTLNEPLFMECARALARRTLAAADGDAERLQFAVRSCVGRDAKPEELAVLTDFLRRQKERFHGAGADPAALLADADEPPADLAGAPASDLAAWTAVARVVLNLDETITKE